MGTDNPGSRRFVLSMRSMVILLVINLTLLLGMAVPLLRARFATQTTPSPTFSPSPASPTPSPTPSPTMVSATVDITQTPVQIALPVERPGSLAQGVWILSLTEAGYAHLFAYQPQTFPLTRLTDHPWDDTAPALSPDGSRVAFSSRQNGYWDLFLLDLASGSTTRLTDTGEYDGAPTWSPDGLWLAYETIAQNTTQIAVISVEDPSPAPIFLTADSSLNRSPSWSPQGRQIAFISSRDGQDTLLLANLDNIDARFVSITKSTQARLEHPAFSPDGKQIAWASISGGTTTILVSDSQDPSHEPRTLGSGDWPVWSPDGSLVAARVSLPNQTLLSVYQSQSGNLVLPPEPIPGSILGIDWKNGQLPASLPGPLLEARNATPGPLWDDSGSTTLQLPGRPSLVSLGDVAAPNPALSDRADDSFQAMRRRLSTEIGWDYLASLENAFVPLTSPLPPGLAEDWLYTGRGAALNPLPLNAGWIAVVREDYGSQTFWRLYLKTRYQDGSQGAPLQALPWDINARYNGDPQVYEQGGALARAVPAGYWLDFTEFASRFGWERVPALHNWRTYYPGIHFNEYVYSNGLSWQSAMLELYPPEALIKPTSVRFPVKTATPVPTWIRTRTPTPTPLPTLTPTRRPTWTPLP